MDHDKIFVKIHSIKLYNGLLLNISKVFPKLNNKKTEIKNERRFDTSQNIQSETNLY